jgi:dTDP-L-rhamnose 4-epimerase
VTAARGRLALVTGGAGLIGSHLADLLLREGWQVRILDNLEPQTHGAGRPTWVPESAEFLYADVCDRAAITAALDGVEVVFHQAAYGGYMPEMGKFLHVNSFGTAQMLEVIRDENLPVKKVLVASSQVVYSEGAVVCPVDGLSFPRTRPIDQLTRGDWSVHCPRCDGPTTPALMPEEAPIQGETVYAITKIDQERLVLLWGRQTGIPTVALRYACTYGPRQSVFNPYTGVIAIFSTRLLNGRPPVIYEDGLQTRDFCFVEDVARANLLAAESDALDGQAVNIGSGRATSVLDVARTVADALGVHVEPLLRGEFRPGEIRQLTADARKAREGYGFEPSVDLAEGIGRYVAWIESEAGNVREYFSAAEQSLRARRIVHQAAA